MSELTPYQKAALNYKEHISLTANAGSGKTFVLSKRYVEIALNEDVSLRNLVAITFTEKAAAELYKKISDEIELRLATTTNPLEKRKLEKLRRQLVSANISTIHSFCIDILKEFPAEAQIDANFTPIDKTLSDELIQLSVEEIIKTSLKESEKNKNLKYLIRVFASKNIFAKELTSLIEKRKNVLSIAEKIYSKSEQEIAENFHQTFEKFVYPIVNQNLEKIISFIEAINNEVLSQNPKNEYVLAIRDLISRISQTVELTTQLILLGKVRPSLFTEKGLVRLQGYLKKNRDEFTDKIFEVQNYFSEIKDFLISEDHKEIELELAKFGKLLLEYFNETLASYNQKKRQNGYLDFEDILLLTKEILVKEEVRHVLSEKYKFVMVDEYQDTNEIQYEIFMPILDHLRSGNLFVVGDEKQSIYMFRDAEMEIFNRTKKEIEQAGSENNLLILPHSFRMAPDICLFTNYVFTRLFADPNLLFNEVRYDELVCARVDDAKGKIEFLLADVQNAKLTEAELVARKIIHLVKDDKPENKIGFNDITILCRRRKSFVELEKALTKYKIPYNIVGGRGFYQQQIIYDIYNYLSFLLNKEDDAALIGILRSPFFSISDSEIFDISREKGNTYWEKLKSYSLQVDSMLQIQNILQSNIELAHTINIPKLLRKLLLESGYSAVISSKTDRIQELANLEKLINVAQNFSNQEFRTLYDLVNFLSESIETVVDEGDAVPTATDNSIKIMTLHQAKGLEFNNVFLFNAHEKGRSSSVKAKTIQINKNLGILTSVPSKGNYFESYKSAPIVFLHNYIQRKKDLAEIKRLLYVGITRAKNNLFISATHKEFNFPDDSFMSLLANALDLIPDQKQYNLAGNLSFLSFTEKGFSESQKNISITIPLTSEVEEPELLIEAFQIHNDDNKKIFKAREIIDSEKEEIVSATKVAVYRQCPLKYQLTYEFGYSGLFKNYKRSTKEFDFKYNEEEYNLFSDVKGRIIHKILEKQKNMEEVEEILEDLIRNELGTTAKNDELILSIKSSILLTINKFYNSESFNELQSYEHFQNEVEIYTKEDDYFLYGIIDKLIINDEQAIIVDYKTDEIEENEIEERFNQYTIQLKFYSYLVSKLHPEINKYQLRVIFLKHPDRKIIQSISSKEVILFAKEISEVILNVRDKKFFKNLDHCKKCSYSLANGKCVKS
ncbi:MAG: UvrD-helicase domain-containing protein [Ignavibacteriales bacterium]|nr:UvrD-helicase domain-containing protein [Ignavibacteriales bacterium]